MTRTQSFIIFFSIVIVLYGLLNSYIFLRGWHIFQQGSPWRMWYAVIFWFVASSYFLARLLERASCNVFTTALIWLGSFWLGAMAYSIVLLLAIDVLRLANFIVPFFPSFMTRDLQKTREVVGIAVAAVVFLAVVVSYINASNPRIRNLELTIHKSSPLKTLHIAMASDIHLGTIISNHHLEKIVDKINFLNPDLVLFPGDIVDEDIGPVIRQNLGETLRKIKSTYGIYAVTGNHEYIGGAEPACKYLTEHGIRMLRDTFVTVANSFVLVGREDLSSRQ